MITINKYRVVVDRHEIKTASDLNDVVTDVRRYDTELDVYYDSGERQGVMTRIGTVSCKDVGYDPKQPDDCFEFFSKHPERFFEALVQ